MSRPTPQKKVWPLEVGARFAKMKRTREQIAGLAALAEHARAVRAVKRFISDIEFEMRYGSGDHHREHAAQLKLANDILAALKKGRA